MNTFLVDPVLLDWDRQQKESPVPQSLHDSTEMDDDTNADEDGSTEIDEDTNVDEDDLYCIDLVQVGSNEKNGNHDGGMATNLEDDLEHSTELDELDLEKRTEGCSKSSDEYETWRPDDWTPETVNRLWNELRKNDPVYPDPADSDPTYIHPFFKKLDQSPALNTSTVANKVADSTHENLDLTAISSEAQTTRRHKVPLKRSVTEAFQPPQNPTERQGLLSDEAFQNARLQPYDIQWMSNHGVTTAEFPHSTMKLEKLVREKVIREGDRIVLGQSIALDGRNAATIVGVSKASCWPTYQIPSPGSPAGFKVLRDLSGTKKLWQGFVEELGSVKELPGLHEAHVGDWGVMTLWRNGQNLGTLFQIRRDYNLWLDQMDEYAVRKDLSRRRRNTKGLPDTLWRRNRFVKTLPDGRRQVLEDQHKFDKDSRYR